LDNELILRTAAINNLTIKQLKTFFKYIFLFSALLLTVILRGQPSVPDRPSPARLVNDFAGLLSADQNRQLEQQLIAYDDSSSNQVAIITLPSLGDYAIEDWALEIGRKWGVGRKAKNNGVLIIVSVDPRKINISPGYGLEGALPDILCKRIITNEITPSFKQGQYFEGFSKGVKAIRATVKGEYVNADRSDGESSDSGFWLFIVLFMVILIAYIVISNSRNRASYYGPNRRRHYENSGGGGWIFWGGGGSSGGSDWGGGGSDDSFGGFGGGDFGGGGASGDW
jgi:uncharacterized protein